MSIHGNYENCPHCGAQYFDGVEWECGTTSIIDDEPLRSPLCREREEHNRTKEELARINHTLSHTKEWWATRSQTMSDWVRKNKVEIGEEFVAQYFSIIANGSATHSEPETYATLLNIKEHRINALSVEIQKLRDMLERAIDTLEHAEICYLVAGGKILRSEFNHLKESK